MRNPFLQPVCAPTARRLSVVGHFDPARRQNQHLKIPVAERRIGKTAPGRLKSTRDCSGFLLLPAQPLRQTGCRKGQILSLHAPGIPGKEKKQTDPLTFSASQAPVPELCLGALEIGVLPTGPGRADADFPGLPARGVLTLLSYPFARFQRAVPQ